MSPKFNTNWRQLCINLRNSTVRSAMESSSPGMCSLYNKSSCCLEHHFSVKISYLVFYRKGALKAIRASQIITATPFSYPGITTDAKHSNKVCISEKGTSLTLALQVSGIDGGLTLWQEKHSPDECNYIYKECLYTYFQKLTLFHQGIFEKCVIFS